MARQLLKQLVRELDVRAPAAKTKEAREAIQSVKHAIESVLDWDPHRGSDRKGK